jgi:hypothetical protein
MLIHQAAAVDVCLCQSCLQLPALVHRMQVLSWYPRIVLFPAFADNATVVQIIALAKPLLQPSELGTAALTDEQKANQPVWV